MGPSWLGKWRTRGQARRQEAAYKRHWHAFSRYPTLADGRHDDAAWRAHSGRFACCLIRVPANALQPRLDALRSELASRGTVRVHPDHFLHIMIQEIGFTSTHPSRSDELSFDRFDELTAAFSSSLKDIAAFDISVCSANSFEDAAFLEIQDGARCAAVHGRLREVAAVPMIPRYGFLPHVTIAHYLGSVDSIETLKTLQQYRDTQFGSFRVMEIEIATLRVDIDYPPIHSVRKINLRQ
jgi:2'-5' RNA ligase